MLALVSVATLAGAGCALLGSQPSFVEPYYEVAYDLSGSTLAIAGTPMKAGDGVFPLGPGRLVLEIDASGAEGGLVRLRELRLEESFTAGRVETALVMELRSPIFGRYDGTSRVLWEREPAKLKVGGIITCKLRSGLCELGDLDRGENAVARRWKELVGPLQFRLKPDRRYQFGMKWLTDADDSGIHKLLHLRGREVERKLIEPPTPES